jgi:uracil-DNA glycosylase
MSGKLESLLKIYEETSKCTLCKKFNRKNSKSNTCDGLINYFTEKNIYLNIPSIWTDWVNRIDSKIMIIGQDWGPYVDMEKYNSRYKKLVDKGEDKEIAWKNILNEKESRTKSLMTDFLVSSAIKQGIYVDERIMESCFVTNAVLCARKGKNYRGTGNFSAKFCTENCSELLDKQINVIKPLVVITLGYWPFYSICKYHNISMFKTLKENISHYSLNNEHIINISHENKPIYVVPAYHPVAQVKKEEQISVYEVVWKILLRYYSRDNLINELNTYKYRRGDLGL